MRWIPSSRRVRIGGIVALGVLVAGAVVGAGSFDDDSGDSASSVTETRAQGEAPAAMPSRSLDRGSGMALSSGGADGGGGAAFEVAEDGVASSASGGGLDPVALGGEALADVSGADIVKTATLDLEVDEGTLRDVQRDVLRAIGAAEGFVQSSSSFDGGASFTFRVPSEEFEALLADLREFGDVRSESVSGEDVSAEFVDLEARLRHWRAQEAVFLELMGRASTIEQTIEIRRELSVIQETIEQIEGRTRFLEDRVAFSTLTLELFDPAAPGTTPDEPEASILSRAWDDAWETAQEVVGGTLVVLGALVPLSVIVGLPLMIVAVALRRRRPVPPHASSSAA